MVAGNPIWAASGGPPVVAFGGKALLPDARDPGVALEGRDGTLVVR